MKIALDAGHGGINLGAVGVDGLLEKTVNLNVALMVGQLLKQHPNMDTYYTRSTDVDIPLAERASYANAVFADYFISFHSNSSLNATYNGTETLIYRKGSLAERFAQCVQTALVAEIKTKDNGVTERPDLVVLRSTSMPAILIELAFVSNPQNADILQNRQDAIARGIYKGICAFLCLSPILPVRFTFLGPQSENMAPVSHIGKQFSIPAARKEPVQPAPATMQPVKTAYSGQPEQSGQPVFADRTPAQPISAPVRTQGSIPAEQEPQPVISHVKDEEEARPATGNRQNGEKNAPQASPADEYMAKVRERFDASMNKF